MILHLTKTGGKWKINDKQYHELNPTERRFLEDFIIQSKQELKPEKEQRKAPDWGEILKQKTKPHEQPTKD